MSQLSISDERMSQLRDIFKLDERSKFNIKSFLKANKIDPAYMNFYKFIKDDEFSLPLLGLLKLVESNGFNIQLCITSKETPLDDSNEWNSFLEKVSSSVEANSAIKEFKSIKKRDSSNLITKSMSEEDTTSGTSIKDLYDEIW